MTIRFDKKDVSEDVMRFDLARISPRVTTTPQGFMKAPAFVTKPGVFEYRRADGKMQRELRLPEDVFHEDSLATISNAPITRDHPSCGWVNADNARDLSIGHLSETVTREDNKVGAIAIITEKQAIQDVHKGDLREFSMGYKCKVEWTNGVHPEYGRYDCIQRNIRYNHAAMGGKSWGRAGEDVVLRLDSGAAIRAQTAIEDYVRKQMALNEQSDKDMPSEFWGILGGWVYVKKAEVQKLADWLDEDFETLWSLIPESDRADSKGVSTVETIKVTIGGVDFDVPKNAGQAFQAEMSRHDSQVKELKKENDQLQARFDSQTEELKQTKTKVEELSDESRFDSRVQEHLSLINKARKVLGDDAKIEGSSRSIMEAVLRHDNKDIDLEGKSEDYITARFDALIERAPQSTKRANRRAIVNRMDSIPQDDVRDSDVKRQDSIKKSQDAWKQPLSTSTRANGGN